MGHIQRRGDKWQARYRAPDGRERSKRFDRKIDAENWINVQKADIARGLWVDPVGGKVTLGEYANEWLGGRTNLRPTTRGKYRGLLDLHIIPSLGAIPISQLTSSVVRAWHADLHSRHPSTAAGAYRLLSTICRTAVDDDLIVRSPCRVKGAASEKTPERPVASIAELAAAVAAAPDHYQSALLLAGWCQLRRGEVLGLQRKDVNIERASLTVMRSWVQTPGGEVVMGPPKTKAGRRTVAIPSHILPILESHLQTVGESPEAWLFSGNDGNPAHPRTLSRIWTKARSSIGRPDLHLHDLRHSGLTWAAATGASLAELMRRAGHDSPAAALRYQHATADRDKALADALADMATGVEVPTMSESNVGTADNPRTDESDKGGQDATITPLTSKNSEQSQRGSNPCLHLERVVS